LVLVTGKRIHIKTLESFFLVGRLACMYVSASVYVADSKRVRSQKQSNNKGTKREKNFKKKEKNARRGGKWAREGIERDRGRDSKSLFAVLSSFVVVVSCACTVFLYLDGERVFFDFLAFFFRPPPLIFPSFYFVLRRKIFDLCLSVCLCLSVLALLCLPGNSFSSDSTLSDLDSASSSS
jgi:hypothetical protein